jgi:chromosome segregation ATPase
VQSVFLTILYTEILFSQTSANEVCDKIGEITDTLKRHEDVLNDFEQYEQQIQGLENKVRTLEFGLDRIKENLGSLIEYQTEKGDLLNDVMKIKTVSNRCWEKLESLDSYQGSIYYIVEDVAHLKGSVESLTHKLSYTESLKETTDILQNDVMNIRESISNYSLKRDEAAHQRIDTFYRNYTIRENVIEIQLQKLYNLTETQNETAEKLNELKISLQQVENEQYALHNKYYTQEKNSGKLDNHTNALHKITTEQQIMNKELEELTDQLEQLLKSQATTPVIQMIKSASTEKISMIPTTPPPTEQPNCELHIIKKHGYAQGNNISITV